MDKHPDKYFSNKLSSYRKEPPSGAWDRIDANLGNVKPRFVWMKLAAGVLLLIVAGLVFFTRSNEQAEVSVSQPKVNTPTNSSIDSITQKPEIKEQPEFEETKSQHIAHNTKNLAPSSNLQNHKHVREEKLIVPPMIQHADVVESEAQLNAEINAKEFVEPVSEQIIPSRVITYSAQEVNKKYLRIRKKEAVVYTDPVKEKPTIGEIASDIKHNTVGIGDLRQIKDDLLSLELFAQNDKSKTQ